MSQEASPLGESVLLRQARDKFTAAFKHTPTVAACAPGRVNLIGDHIDYCEGYVLPVLPTVAACAPGRVNLIGDHIDYCEGYVLPAALPFLTLVVGSYNNSSSCKVLSVHSGQEREVTFPAPTDQSPLQPGAPAWANYIKGVVAHFPGAVKGFDAVVVSDVPIGAGVSSSAALEVAFFSFLEALTSINIDPVKKALLCQKAEHTFPGMPCGIMDQYIASLAKPDHALLIDCRSLEAKQIPVMSEDVVFLVINSNVKHQLTGSEYPQRRAQCQEAAEILGYPSLRNASAEDIDKLKKSGCDQLVVKRARHVVDEICRTEQVAKSLQEKDFQKVGRLFYESHESLSELMEVSCQELDSLVDMLRGADGVWGARMTGGGFGGCVVALVQSAEVKNVQKRVSSMYKGTPTFFVCKPSNGSRIIQL